MQLKSSIISISLILQLKIKTFDNCPREKGIDHSKETTKIFKATVATIHDDSRNRKRAYTVDKTRAITEVCAFLDRQIVRLVARAIGGNDFVFVAHYLASLGRCSFLKGEQLIFPRIADRRDRELPFWSVGIIFYRVFNNSW